MALRLGAAAGMLAVLTRPFGVAAAGEDGTVFSFDHLTEEMRSLAALPHRATEQVALPLGQLTYDDWRLIRFRSDRARWTGDGGGFRLHAFHPGWLFPDPVALYQVTDGVAQPMTFGSRDFEYLGELSERAPEGMDLPGVAGFRLTHPLNRPGLWDEVVAFLGASYFRALGRGSVYGISARGLALNTALAQGEEFPRFTRFYLVRPAPDADRITLCAALESPSVTGACRFEIRPGDPTEMEVTARLFFRADVAQIGVAPLTSMFLFDAKNRADFDDYRPQVHDSNGLAIHRADGERLWRPLNNPPVLANSYFAEDAPRAFGLHQRGRDFSDYQDSGARYDRRPSLRVVPLDDWGPGWVRLLEIPTELETNDNIVAFWVPEAPARAGEAREYRYRLDWGDLTEDADNSARNVSMRAGVGGVSGVPAAPDTRKFVVDFAGGALDALPADAPVSAALSARDAEITGYTLERIEPSGVWRLVIDAAMASGAVAEFAAHLETPDGQMSEGWRYQWIAP
jgi:periplasmic glucans biosynthesis protein